MSARNRLARYATLATLLVVPLSVNAAGLSASQIQEISDVATAALRTQHLPGLSVAISKNGQVWSAGFGKADLEHDVPVTARSMFRTASVAKWFTAAAAMRLTEDGKLDLDAPIRQYCAAFPDKQWPITSRQLLTHMAGIRHNHGDNGEQPATDAERLALDLLIQREKSGQYTRYTDVIKPLDAFKDDPLLFRPGTRVQYSSPGYRLLGCVLEGAAKMPYRKLMRDLVFAPAGMQTITEDDALALVPHRVTGYSKGTDDAFVRAAFRDVSENLPAGGWLSTAEDLARFAVAFQSGRLVKPATRDRMIERPTLLDGTPAPNPFGSPDYYYGLGIMVGPTDRPAWFHTGGQSGASVLLYWFPDSQIAVALMTNRDGSAIREPLARKLEEIARRETGSSAKATHSRDRDSPQVTRDAAYRKFENWRTFLSDRSAQTYAITGPDHIDESAYVKIGGIDQWITIRGQDRSNPVLLFLHGGPGDVTNPWSYPYFFNWLKYFTVVQWDQRGAGRTLSKTGDSIGPSMTIKRMTQDGIELTEYLRQHLRQKKIILVGHSWGSVFGALMAKARPDLFHAFVGTGQVVDSRRGDAVAYELALETAADVGNPDDLAALKAIGAPPYSNAEGWRLFYQWRRKCEGAESDRFLGGTMGIAIQSPGYSIRDINDWLDGQVLGGQQLFDQGAQLDPKRLAGDFDVPVFVLQGERDCSTPAELARSYVDSISAPRKEFVGITGAGHFAVFIESDAFLDALVARVRPLATEPETQ